jgi:hypothetical protein
MAFSRLDAIPEDPGGCRDDHGRDDEREHGSVELRMKKEKRADGWSGVYHWPNHRPGR